VLEVGAHRTGEDDRLQVAAGPGEAGDVVAMVTRTVSWSMIGPSSRSSVA
jgi:hypothetical protein